jgi:hypothetical protein
MNERIKELARQASITIVPEPFDDASRAWNNTMEKFAVLIVKECLKIVEPDQTSGDEWCVTLDETAQSIRQHFGVEE